MSQYITYPCRPLAPDRYGAVQQSRRLGRSSPRPFGLPFGAGMISPAVALAGGLRLGNAVRGDRRTHYTDMQAWPPAAPPVETALGSHPDCDGAKLWDRRSRGSLRIYCRICFADALRDGLSACTGLAPVLSSLGYEQVQSSRL